MPVRLTTRPRLLSSTSIRFGFGLQTTNWRFAGVWTSPRLLPTFYWWLSGEWIGSGLRCLWHVVFGISCSPTGHYIGRCRSFPLAIALVNLWAVGLKMIVIQVLAWSIPIPHVHLSNFFASPPFNIHPMWASIVANVVRFVVAVIVDQRRIADISTIV